MRHIGILRLLAYITAITMLAALALPARTPAQEPKQEHPRPELLSIAVTPADASIFPDRMEQFTATGTYSDGRTHDLTRRVKWTSSVPDVATISWDGVARTVGEGQTTIGAKLEAINGSTTLNVTRFVWTGSMNTARENHTATLLNNGTVLIAAGVNTQGTVPLTSAEVYDPATGTFSPTGSMNTARQQHRATLLNNGMVLITGGCCDSQGQSLASAEVYDPATGTFSPTGSMNTARYLHTATLLNNGKVLVAGGWNTTTMTPLASAELYDPATGNFTPTGSMHSARFSTRAIRLNDGTVLIPTGETYWTGGFLYSAELYNPATGTFTYTTGSLNAGRGDEPATLLNNGMVLVAGGFWGNYSAELYNPSTETFSYTGSLNAWRAQTNAALLNNGMALIPGGYEGIASAELYDPVAGTFTYTDSMNAARANLTVTLLENGMVLVAGGYYGNYNELASAELYEPATRTPPDLESIAITPERSDLSPGETQHFIATGRFRDGGTQQLASVTWRSSNPAVAQISNDASNHGVGLAIDAGTSIIEAKAGHVKGWALLTVRKNESSRSW